MAIKTIDCVDCGAPVPDGRLSCPACGALLASVAGGYRAGFRIPEPKAVQARVGKAEQAVVRPTVAVQAHERARPRSLPKRPPAVPAVTAAERPVDVELAVEHPTTHAFARPSVRPASVPRGPTPWPPLHGPAPILIARPYGRHIPDETELAQDHSPRPGAYRPPMIALAAAAPVDRPAGVAPVAPRWPPVTAAPASAMTASPETRDTPGSTKRVMDAGAFVEISGWFVIVGATMAVLGFLLPWSVSVIGSRGVGGYFNGWGLASPTHVLVVVGLLAVLALGVVRTPVPAWLACGVLGLAFGSLLIGLVWPYLVGPLGADVGVTVTALGGLALIVGGAVASWATRHAASDPRV